MTCYPPHEPPEQISDEELDEWLDEACRAGDLAVKQEREEQDDRHEG